MKSTGINNKMTMNKYGQSKTAGISEINFKASTCTTWARLLYNRITPVMIYKIKCCSKI